MHDRLTSMRCYYITIIILNYFYFFIKKNDQQNINKNYQLLKFDHTHINMYLKYL